jgi:hypothetical protein
MADPIQSVELDAINTMLSAIGETPTTGAIAVAGSSADVVMAKQILDEIGKEVQSQGWHFNTDYNVELTPNGSNNIVLASNIARVDVDGANAGGQDVIQRYHPGTSEQRLYNKADNDFIFESVVKANVIYLFEFVGLPETAKRYITVKASRVFQDRLLGSVSHHRFSQEDEYRALADLKEWEGDTGDHSIFDSFSVYSAVRRGNTIK